MLPVRFADVYSGLLQEAIDSPKPDENKRTRSQVYTLRGGVSFLLDLSDRVLPTPGIRRVYPKTAAAEVAWFLRGDQDIRWLRQYSKIWDQFVEDDGRTVEAAYGYRWRRHFDRDQLLEARDTLLKDPSDRRVVVQAWDPSRDGLLTPGQLNVPCPTHFTFTITRGELHTSLFIRSSDLFVGLPYDVMGHAMLAGLFAESVHVKLGTMHVTLANAHLYQQHLDFAIQANRQTIVTPAMGMSRYDLEEVIEYPDDFVHHYIRQTSGFIWPEFDPKPEVVK